ncbi:MAG: hypothetical protein HDS67_01980 [Bacteroidales bacterium]|nr:hypothetical protein [Bacteroidales bacterium]
MAKKKKKKDEDYITSEKLKKVNNVEVRLEIPKEDFDALVRAMMGIKDSK